MALQHTPDTIVFTAKLPDYTRQSFTFGEYLGWRESVDVPIPEHEWILWTTWMEADNNNLGRISVWINIRDWRKKYPNHPATVAARKSGVYQREN